MGSKRAKVIVGFDARQEAQDALMLGRELSASTGAELHVAVVHPRGEIPFERAIARESLSDQIDDELFDAARRELEGTDFVPAKLAGGLGGRSAARALYEYARDQEADLIVVGSTHRGRLGRVLPGSVGESLLRGSPCAVAIAPRGFADGAHPPLGLIGVGWDGSREAEIALAEAERLAAATGAGMRLITVVPELSPLAVQAPELAEIHASMERAYAEVLERGASLLDEDARAETVLKEGDPAAVLADQGVEVDLLVIGSRGYGPVRTALLGATSAAVIRSAPCPVIVTPRGIEAPAPPARAQAGAETSKG